ncbi:hypothetical protein WJX81_007347 [Elliptochloris bilobata]|uniref:Mitochondrial proton/calcium exchanger protein n=1 Tax=Elliptochloris bilobata TaxID=381761 RepID=A0AAW1SJE4_9CHLO
MTTVAASPPSRPPAAGSARAAPDLCDEALSDLRTARSKAQSRLRQQFAETSWAERVRSLASTAFSAVRVAAVFSVTLPGRMARFLSRPWAEQKEVYRGWWATAKKEARHYWLGTKLLGADIKIASRLVYKVLNGATLTRRERKQLTRTTADVFRLVPMLVFLVVPFMEFLLPVALRLFPNMLPSTFEDKLKKEEELKKRVGAKLEVARFLQDTVQEMAKDMKSSKTGATQSSAAELYDFLRRVRAGEVVSQYEIMRFAQLFNDELTLDNLERIHLVNLCRFVGIQPFGTDAFLVSRLRTHLAAIKADDRAIKEEGLDNLSEEELRSACRSRGMRAPFGEGAAAFMRRQLAEWLDLSLNRALPSSLLLLSRAFTVTQPFQTPKPTAAYDSLKETLGALPNKVIEDVSMQAEGADDYERKLTQLRREEELIHEEAREAAAVLRAEMPVLQAGETAQHTTAAAAAAAVVREATAAAMAAHPQLEGASEEERISKLAAAKEERMRKVISALAVLASSSGVSSERAAFMQLVRAEIERLNQQLGKRGSVSMVFQKGSLLVERPAELEEVVGQKRLADRVTGILSRIEEELDHVDSRIGEAMHVLDADNDGLISTEELQTAMGFLREQLGEEELRALLGDLNAWSDDGASPIPVGKLMELAAQAAPSDAAKAVAAKAQ